MANIKYEKYKKLILKTLSIKINQYICKKYY